VTGFLDWHTHPVGPPLPCRLCGRPAMCRDDHHRPCHKTCAEAALTAPATETGGGLIVDLAAYRHARTDRRAA
jgi:hypothetical protein